ncbi:MAG: hypothetical protein Q4F84_02390 [Fibrobacter sp.]|nr:hypothetical protein [Fibrobacter sp.]
MMIRINKIYLKHILHLINLIIIVSCSVAESLNLTDVMAPDIQLDNCDSVNLKPCTQEKINEFFKNKVMRHLGGKIRYRNYTNISFKHFFEGINCSECTIGESELKKILAVQYFELEKDTSELAEYMKNAVSGMIARGGWGPDYEKMVIQRAEDAKKKQDWSAYYDFVWELAYYSPQQWFKYSMIFFHAKETNNDRRGRKNICSSLFQRLNDTNDKGILDTVVSLTYTMIKNGLVSFDMDYDELLAKFSEGYKYSKQRIEFLGRLAPFYEQFKNKVEWKYKYYVDYVNKVKKEMAEKKKLIDYVPPVKIE